MNRRKFIKTGATTALVAAGTGESALASGVAVQTKARRPKRKVSTDRAPKPVGPYSQAMVAGNTIYVAGQGPFDPKTGKMPRLSKNKQSRSSRTSRRSLSRSAPSPMLR